MWGLFKGLSAVRHFSTISSIFPFLPFLPPSSLPGQILIFRLVELKPPLIWWGPFLPKIELRPPSTFIEVPFPKVW